MRNAAIAMIGAALIASGSAGAQAPAAPRPPADAPRQNDETTTTIKSVNVVDLDALPAAAQEEINQHVTKQPAEKIQQIRTAIESEPKLKSALASKGFAPRDVVTAALDSEGELTIVAKRAA